MRRVYVLVSGGVEGLRERRARIVGRFVLMIHGMIVRRKKEGEIVWGCVCSSRSEWEGMRMG
jgi:hypothetical protein